MLEEEIPLDGEIVSDWLSAKLQRPIRPADFILNYDTQFLFRESIYGILY
jgi:hypothetical protein